MKMLVTITAALIVCSSLAVSALTLQTAQPKDITQFKERTLKMVTQEKVRAHALTLTLERLPDLSEARKAQVLEQFQSALEVANTGGVVELVEQPLLAPEILDKEKSVTIPQ